MPSSSANRVHASVYRGSPLNSICTRVGKIGCSSRPGSILLAKDPRPNRPFVASSATSSETSGKRTRAISLNGIAFAAAFSSNSSNGPNPVSCFPTYWRNFSSPSAKAGGDTPVKFCSYKHKHFSRGMDVESGSRESNRVDFGEYRCL